MASSNTYSSKSIGGRVRARRLELGYSQRDLDQPGLTYAYISRIEAGDRRPSWSALAALAELLDTSALYLLTGDDHVPCPLCGRHEHGGSENGKRNNGKRRRRQ
jgi:DNA-binding XRE family transcriptional regulator